MNPAAAVPITPESPQAGARRIAKDVIARGFKPDGLFRYNLANGEPWCWRVRCKHPNGDKWFRPMRREGGQFIVGEPKGKPEDGKPLYVPPFPLIDFDPVLVVEGEKCADAAARLGLNAVTSGAADSAMAADFSMLRGRSVLIFPDHDDAGRKYAETVRRRLAGIASKVDTIDSDRLGLGKGGDIVDWLGAHPDSSAADVLALPRVEPCTPLQGTPKDGAVVDLIRADSIVPEPIQWLWSGWLARGKAHVLAGAPGTGKTTLAMDIAARVSSGKAFPDGSRPKRGSVVIWSGEDDPRDTLVPRLLAAGADLGRVRFVGDVHQPGESRPFDPATDVPALADSLPEDIALLVVDPLVSAVAGDGHKNNDVRRGLAPLVELAASKDAALLGITHYSKGTNGREPLERVSGSLAYGALARVVWGTVDLPPALVPLGG